VALVSAYQVPLTEMYPVIAVGVQVLPPEIVTLIEVLAVSDPEEAFTVIVAVPEAELLAEIVIVSPLTLTETPEFELLAVSVTLEAPDTEIVSVVLEPGATVTAMEAEVIVRLPPPVPPPLSGDWIPANSDCFKALAGVGS